MQEVTQRILEAVGGSRGHPWSRPVGSAAALRSKFSRRCALKQRSLMTQMWKVNNALTSPKYMRVQPQLYLFMIHKILEILKAW